MNAINFNGGGSLSIEKVLDQGVFSTFRFTESLYGEVPEMSIKVQSDTPTCELNELLHGTLKYDDGSAVQFEAYVYDITGFFRDWEYKLILMNPKMIRDVYSLNYKGIIQAVTSTCSRLKSELVWNEPMEGEDGIYQINESNLKFVNRIAMMYRKGVVFGHCIDGTIFIDTNNFKSAYDFTDGTDFHITSSPSFTSSKLYSKDTENCNYSISQDPYHIAVQFDNKLIFANKEYSAVIENHLYNSRFKTSTMITNGYTPAMHNLPCGTMVTVNSERINFKKCIISSRTIEVDKGGATKSTYSIQSLVNYE